MVSYCLWSVSYTFPVFVMARGVAGLSKGIVGISAAIVTDVTTPQHRSKAMVSTQYTIIIYTSISIVLSVVILS